RHFSRTRRQLPVCVGISERWASEIPTQTGFGGGSSQEGVAAGGRGSGGAAAGGGRGTSAALSSPAISAEMARKPSQVTRASTNANWPYVSLAFSVIRLTMPEPKYCRRLNAMPAAIAPGHTSRQVGEAAVSSRY